MRRTARVALATCTLALASASVSAETAYVIDRLLVGVHEDKGLESAIIKVLPTGSALEVLERDGDFARISTDDGTTGWVDASYLMVDKPALLRVPELEAELEQLRIALADAEARVEALQPEAMAPAETVERAAPSISTDALREIQGLAEENQQLKDRLAETLGQLAAAESEPPPVVRAAPAAQEPLPMYAMQPWQWLLLACTLLLGIGLGAWLIDWDVRRRHGGFRI